MGFPLPTTEDHLWVCILTARCNMVCSYCIQKGMVLPGGTRKPWRPYEELSGAQWVRALNDLPVRPRRPLILTGGEPSLHRDFLEIVTGLEGYDLDLTTNLSLDLPALARAMEKAGKRFHTSFHTYAAGHLTPEEFLERADFIRRTGLVANPYFNIIDLDDFPQFRTPETTSRIQNLRSQAATRGIPLHTIEFRANHMGRPFARESRETMECSSGWVNIAPDGAVFNCQYHLTENKLSFGNITDRASLKHLPPLGSFFTCQDFGWCDPCHENSGRGMFRQVGSNDVFRRDPDASFLAYTRWLSTNELTSAGQQFVDEGKPSAGVAFLLEAFKRTNDPVLLNDLGVAFWSDNRPQDAFACFTAAIRKGCPDPAVTENLLALARELGEETRAQSALLDSGIIVPPPPPTTPLGATTHKILVDFQGYWGLGDLLCADPLIDSLAKSHPTNPVEIRLRGKAGNLLHHPSVAGKAADDWPADRVVTVPFLTHMPTNEYDKLEALPALTDHMCSYAGVTPTHRRPRLHLTATERELAGELHLARIPGQPLIALCSDFFDSYRHWARERWIEVVQHLIARGARIVEVGLQDALGAGLDLAGGKLPLRVIGAVIEKCDLFLGHNTGTFHYAQAAGTPCVTLFSFALPQRFIHDDALVVPIQARLACINCQSRKAETGSDTSCHYDPPGECMRQITVTDVCASLDRFLDEYYGNLDPMGEELAGARAFRAANLRAHAGALTKAGYPDRAADFAAMANRLNADPEPVRTSSF